MDEFIETELSERQASYSNNGPGVDVFAPADETLSAGMRAANGDQLGTDTNYDRYNSDFVDMFLMEHQQHLLLLLEWLHYF